MKSAKTIAQAFLCLSDPDVGDVITNLKLQKLLYYAQGFNLAINKEPIFKEDVLAWEHGPVVREVYNLYRDNSAAEIPTTACPSSLTKAERVLIENVWKVYGQFSAWKLRDMTHNESPWQNTDKNKIISHTKLKTYFKTLVTAD